MELNEILKQLIEKENIVIENNEIDYITQEILNILKKEKE